MNPVIHSENHHSIVYDADLIPESGQYLFDPQYWNEEGAISGQATGRGSTLLLDTSFGPAVLRLYLRGGWPARVSRDRYVLTGLNRSRPFREFSVLQQLAELDLPAPAPIAALCTREGIFYRGALLMRRIMNVAPLNGLLGSTVAASPVWRETGSCIRRFHEAGVNHADLNAGNLLFDQQAGKVFLVDFDRCTLNPGSTINGKSNLARLHRSLAKLWPQEAAVSLDACWQQILDGYGG